MTFCGNCGARVEEAVKFCPACGNPMPAQQTPPVQQQAQPAQPQYPEIPPQPAVPLYAEPPAYTPPVMPGAATQADIQDAQENKTMAILAYILFFIPLLTGAHKTSAFAKRFVRCTLGHPGLYSGCGLDTHHAARPCKLRVSRLLHCRHCQRGERKDAAASGHRQIHGHKIKEVR